MCVIKFDYSMLSMVCDSMTINNDCNTGSLTPYLVIQNVVDILENILH